MPEIYIDADGCPVKNEVYKVAERYNLKVYVVANRFMKTPQLPFIEPVIVGNKFDEADDWIAERAKNNDLVITTDIPLAQRCLKNFARVLGPKGREFTAESIGDAMAARELNAHLRDMGVISGGPKPLKSQDKSKFLSKMDEIVNAMISVK